jgi:hypothetical protein
MAEGNPVTGMTAEHIRQMRHLSHDLSNALEIILQTSYLLGTANLDADGRKWCALLDGGVQQATRINRDLRNVLREQASELDAEETL